MNKKETIIISITILSLLFLTNFMTYFYLTHKFNLKLKLQKYEALQTIKFLENGKKQINCELMRDYLSFPEFNCKQ